MNQKPAVDFTALVVCCVHRAVDSQAWDSLNTLSACPNPRMVVRFKSGDALIDRSRSYVASRFLMDHPESEVLMFIDDDVVFNPRDAVKIARLVKDESLDIVGGAYMIKQADNPRLAVKTFDGDRVIFGENGAVQKVENVSTGFMAIHRRVLEKMAKTLPLCHPGDMKFYPFFQPYPKEINGSWVYLSEDWAFCQRAQDLGFSVWLDTTTKLSHAGRYVYDWDDLFRPGKVEHKNFEYTDTGSSLVIKDLKYSRDGQLSDPETLSRG